MLFLDFDGVVCDALPECALVTWFGVHHLPDPPDGPIALAQLPAAFLDRFRRVRNYSRLLDHFLVAHLTESAGITSQDGFDRMFATLSPERVATFTATASAARAALRSRQPEFWLGLHTLYPGATDLFEQYSGGIVIITAKDVASTTEILAHHGLAGAVAHIEGECADKARAVARISTELGIDPSGSLFVDDNLANVLRVRETGTPALWALWGYHTADHVTEADRAAVRAIDRLAQVTRSGALGVR